MAGLANTGRKTSGANFEDVEVCDSFFLGIPGYPWFLDRDDNTLVLLQTATSSIVNPGTLQIVGVQKVDAKATPCAAIDSFFELEVDPPLPSDFFFKSGSISRFADRLSLFVEEETPSRVGLSSDVGVFGAIQRTYITRYDFINTEEIGTSTGATNQSLSVSGSEILLPTKGTPTVFVGEVNVGNKWSVTDDLSTAEATDRVFEYDETTGTVTFGDGINGAIPATGQTITLRISIRDGGGFWSFAGIIVDPKAETHIGLVKAVRDKILYAQTKIAAADVSTVTQVKSTMNVITQKRIIDGHEVKEIRIWSLALGGEVTTEGNAIVKNCSVGQSFILPKTPRDEGEVACRDHRGNVVTCGSALDRAEHITLTDVDGYPDMKMTSPSGGSSLVESFDDPLQVVEVTPVQGGVITSPKLYSVDVTVFPIFEIWEIIIKGRIIVHAPDVDGEPCSIEFDTSPSSKSYTQFWFTWPDTFFYPQIPLENRASPNQLQIIDSDEQPHTRTDFTPIATSRGELKMTQIADVIGTFSNDVRSVNLANDPNDCGVSNIGDREIGGTTTVQTTIFGDSIFVRYQPNDDTRHPEWATMKWELRNTDEDKNRMIDIFGGEVFPGFTCQWVVEEGTVTELPDVIEEATEIISGGECVNFSFSQTTPEDIRMSIVDAIFSNVPGVNRYPFVCS